MNYPEKCEFCPRKFKLKSQLMNHEVVHFEGKTFDCDCGSKFLREKDYKDHLTQCHYKYDFVCGCGKKFHKERLYTKHQKNCEAKIDYPQIDIIESIDRVNFRDKYQL